MFKLTFEYTQEMIEEVLDEMDFERISRVMCAVDWQWRDEGVPRIGELRKEGRRLLRTAVYEASQTKSIAVVGRGGLEAECDGFGVLKLRFVVADYEVDFSE
jgi:hypothetical protein